MFFYKNVKGLLEDELWDGYSQSMTSFHNTDGGKEFWKYRKGSFSNSFGVFLEASDTREVFIPQ
jgi:hypothetical protein